MARLQLSFLSSMGSDFAPQRPQLRQQQKQNPISGIKTMKAMPGDKTKRRGEEGNDVYLSRHKREELSNRGGKERKLVDVTRRYIISNRASNNDASNENSSNLIHTISLSH